MFDSFVPSSGNTWDKSFNSSFTSECGNAEPADAITPGVAIKNIPASGATGEVIDIPPPAPASDFSLILLDTPLPEKGEFTTSRHETQAVDAITRQALPAAVVEGAISSAHSALAEFASDPDFANKMNLAFGEGWDAAVAGDLAQDWLTGDFSELPPVEIRAGAEINGANGAFAAATDTIYLSSEFVAGNAGRPEAIVSVLLEEMGHYIDSRINTSDAAGDEGAIFAGAVQGKEFDTAELQALKAEDDTATVMLDGQAILIEQDNTLSAARVITVGSTTTTYSDWVGTTDTNDYYRFSLSNNSNFNLTLNGLSADADVQLLDSYGNVIQGSYYGGTTADTISRSLDAGTYYLQVYPMSGVNTSYNLSLTATPVYSIGSLSLNQTQSGSLSTTDRANPARTGSFSDDYRLSGFSAGQQVQLDMSSTAFDSYLQLVNESTGQVIQFDDDSGGNNNSRLSFTAQSGVSYLVRATSYGSGSTGSYSLSAAPVVPPPTVTISATDASAGETLSGQTANPGQFTISRTGSTAAALTVNYSVAGTATNGTDYSNLTGSVTIAAGATSALVPINVIDDSLVEGNETATVTLAANTAYTVGSANTATLTIADNDPTTVPIALNQSLSGTLSTTDPNNPTRSGSYRDDYQLTGVSAGQQVRVSMNSSFDNYLQVVNAATGAVIAENDDANGTANAEVTFTVQSGVSYLLRATSYSGGVTGSYTITTAAVAPPPTVTISATDASAGETLSGQTANPGQFTISRTGSTAAALTVNYSLAGTATNGTDYSNLTGSVTIAAGATSAAIPVNVIDDSLVEGNETATVTLAANTAYTVGSANTATVTIADNDSISDWFTQNIRDAGLQSAARSRSTDSVLDRNDMIAIFRDAKDGSVIDATELTDLRTLVSNASRFNMSDPVRVLSNKIANGNTANQWYQGSSLGNLYAGSTATQMENLIGKWFLGSDRPTAPYTYQYASGSLFQNGVSYQDIVQGSLGDCYFLASLAATAFRTPTTIQSMFTDNGDSTYTVRFYNSGVADYVTVDRYLPTNSGSLVYANRGNSYSSSANELWVALAEKAYAQINESGWLGQFRNSTNTYSGIEGGLGYYAMPYATGRTTAQVYVPSGITDTNSIVNAFNAGQLITMGSKQSGVASNVVSGHEYTLVGYNSSTQRFTLYNPWGSTVELTSSQITASFDYWAYTTSNGQPQYGSSGILPPPRFLT